MIELVNLYKSFGSGARTMVVARDISVSFPAGCGVALIGRNGAGKSTLLRLIAGSLDPDRGYIRRKGSISWPVGLGSAFHGDLTGAQNAKFLARIHGVDTTELAAFVDDFSELGRQFDQPFKTYSSGMRARFAFAMSMALPFDTYLIDEVTSVGDASFRRKSSDLLGARLQSSGAIVVSHDKAILECLCDCAVVLEDGRLSCYDNLEEAFAAHEACLLA